MLVAAAITRKTTCYHPSTNSACKNRGRSTSPKAPGLPRKTSLHQPHTTTKCHGRPQPSISENGDHPRGPLPLPGPFPRGRPP